MKVLVLSALLLMPTLGRASLLDDPDGFAIFNPRDSVTPVHNINPTGTEINFSSGGWDYKVTANYIQIALSAGASSINLSDVDTDFLFTDLNWGVPGSIIGVQTAFTSSGNIVGGTSGTTFGPDWIQTDASGIILSANQGLRWTLDVNHIPLNPTTKPIPEPSTFLLTGLGLGVAGLVARRKKKAA